MDLTDLRDGDEIPFDEVLTVRGSRHHVCFRQNSEGRLIDVVDATGSTNVALSESLMTRFRWEPLVEATLQQIAHWLPP
jgi:hypothetical protein